MGKRVRYDFELVDGSYVETDKGAAFRISETFGFTNHLNPQNSVRIAAIGPAPGAAPLPRGSPITIRGDVPYRCRAGGEAPKPTKKEPSCVESRGGSRPERKSLMDSSRAKTFQQMADELGIRHKLMYTLREASRVTGVPYDTLRIECKAGRLRSQLPEGRKVGRMVRPEWVEQWIEEGTHGIEAA